MEAMREAWTDERLDDLAHRMDDGFKRVDGDLRELRTEMKAEFGSLRTEMKAEFGSLRGEMKTGFSSLRGEMKAGFSSLRGEIGSVRTEMKTGFSSVRGEIGSVRGEISALHRAMLQVGGGMIATFAIGFAGLIATQL